MKNFLKPFLFICLGLVITTIVFASVRIAARNPGPPEFPKVDNITDNSCRISYKAPSDNGGSPIVLYEIECKEKDSNTWVSKGGTADLSHYVDKMRKGTKAIFRVSAINGVGRSAPAETKEVIFEEVHIAR